MLIHILIFLLGVCSIAVSFIILYLVGRAVCALLKIRMNDAAAFMAYGAGALLLSMLATTITYLAGEGVYYLILHLFTNS